MSIIQELKRRNVIRVAIAYVLLAWVVLQIVDFVLEVIAAPDWILQVFVLAGAIGLPIVLIFSWVFEFTPEGLKRESEIDRSQSVTPATGRKLDRVIIGMLTLAVVFLLADKFLLSPAPVVPKAVPETVQAQTAPPASTPSMATVAAKSIAVLPFVVMSNGLDDEYFADGLTEEILNSLAQLPELLVTARTSAFSFKGQDLPVQEIAGKLGVRNIVEGSVRRSGDRLRVTAQLVRADDGFHLWSENYDSTSEDTIAVQEDIAEKIALAMDVVLDEEKRASMRQAGLRDVEAFIAFQKGRELYGIAHGHADQIGMLRQANSKLEQVLERVPGYPPALRLHSDLYLHLLLNETTRQPMANVSEQEVAEASANARADYTAAIANARSPVERNNLEIDLAFVSANWRGLPARIERYLNAQGCEDSTWVDAPGAIMGYGQRMVARQRESRLCDPLFSHSWVSEVRAILWAGQPQEALEIAYQGVDIAPGAWMNLVLVMTLVANGMFDQGELEIDTRFQVADYALIARSLVAAARGDREMAEIRHQELLEGTGQNGFWRVLSTAWRGDREGANRLAAEVDQAAFGPIALTLLTYWCACGAPFDLSATPNFAATLEGSGFPWPPAKPVDFPLKTW